MNADLKARIEAWRNAAPISWGTAAHYIEAQAIIDELVERQEQATRSLHNFMGLLLRNAPGGQITIPQQEMGVGYPPQPGCIGVEYNSEEQTYTYCFVPAPPEESTDE